MIFQELTMPLYSGWALWHTLDCHGQQILQVGDG